MLTVYSSQKLAMSAAVKSARLWFFWRRRPAMAPERAVRISTSLPRDAGQVIAGVEIEQGRNEARIGLKSAGLGAPHARHTQGGVAVERFALGEQAQVLARDLHGLFGEAGVLVAEQFDFRAVARAALTRGGGDVQAALAILRNRQVNVEGGLIRLEAVGQQLWAAGRNRSPEYRRAGRREKCRTRWKCRAIRRPAPPADLQGTEAPGPERQAVQVELQQVFEEAVLQLEMLRTEESAFGPDHRLQSLHLESQ